MQNIKTKLKKVTATHKGRTIVFSILIFVIAVITAGLWYWNTHKKGIIGNTLENAVREKSGGLYMIKYDSLEMDEIAGNLSVFNMNLLCDSIRCLELKKMGKEPSMLLDIHIPEISVSGVKTPRALIDNEIVGRKLEIKNPVINIIYTNSGKDSSRTLPSKEVYEQLLGKLHFIKADTVMITRAQINTISQQTKKTSICIQNISILLVDVKVDSTSNQDTTRIFFAKESSFTCGKMTWTSASKLYNYIIDSVSISSASSLLRIKNFRLAPTLNEDAFVNSLPIQSDRFDISASEIQMQNINLQQLFEDHIVADKILLSGVRLKIYRDLAIPRDNKNRLGAYPHQLMQNIPVTFQVQKIVVSNGFIEYKERHNISRQAGKIQYYHVNASISNFTNDKKAIAVNNVMTVEMNSRFLDRSPLQVTGTFFLLHPKGRFDLKGTLGAMDATLLNPIIERTGLTHIKSGMIHGAEFSVQGQDYSADGTVKMLYEDLKVAALEKNKGSSQLDKKDFSSFIVNIIIKNSNPKREQDVRVAQVHLDRNTNSSFFNFSWKTILKGLTETVGFKQ
jgi:hypothetical protein